MTPTNVFLQHSLDVLRRKLALQDKLVLAVQDRLSTQLSRHEAERVLRISVKILADLLQAY